MGSDKDYFGVSIDARKSDMQKAIRLGKTEQALSSFFAVFMMPRLFPRTEQPEGEKKDMRPSRCEGMVTNMINRLIVIALEDIGPANPALVRKICITLMNMSNDKASRDAQMLMRIIILMCESKKSRVCSHLYHAYNPKNASKAAEAGIHQHEPSTFADPNSFRFLVPPPPVHGSNAKTELKVHKLYQLDAMKRAAEFHGDENPHADFLKILIKFARSRDPVHALPAFSRYVLAFVYFYAQTTPQGEYFRMLIDEKVSLKKPLNNEPEYTETYGKEPVEEDPLWLEPMDVSVDVHTSAGRKRGRTVDDFRTSGAVVNNECDTMIDEAAKKVYTPAPALDEAESVVAAEKPRAKKRARKAVEATEAVAAVEAGDSGERPVFSTDLPENQPFFHVGFVEEDNEGEEESHQF